MMLINKSKTVKINAKKYIPMRIIQGMVDGETVNDLCKVFSLKKINKILIKDYTILPWVYEEYNEYCKKYNLNFELNADDDQQIVLSKDELDELIKKQEVYKRDINQFNSICYNIDCCNDN